MKNLLMIIVTLFMSVSMAAAQSTSPSDPTPLSGEYTGKGPSKETNYFFGFTAGPGDVSVRLEIKAKDYSTFARIEIGNDPSNLIAMGNMNASTTTGAANITKEFRLDTEQSIRVKLTLDANLSEYTLSLNGGKTAIVGKIGKLSAGGSKIGVLGSSGTKPKASTESPAGAGQDGSLKGMQASASGKAGIGKMSDTGGTSETFKPKPTAAGPTLTFSCPANALYSITQNAEWNAGLDAVKRIPFDYAGVDGKSLVCSYQADNGILRASSTLTRQIPKGYVCTNAAAKDRYFTCKPGIAVQAGP